MVRASLEVGEAPFWESRTAGGSNSRQTGPEVPLVTVVVEQPRHNNGPTRIPPTRHSLPLEQRIPSYSCEKHLAYLGLGLFTIALAAGSMYLCIKLLNYANNDRNNEDQKEAFQCLGVGLGVLGSLYLVTTAIEWWRCSQPKEPGTAIEEIAVAACGPLILCLYGFGRLLGD